MARSTKRTARTKRTTRRRVRPLAPRCSRTHPRLTKNRHVNEHLTFCALHSKAANSRRATNAARKAHQEAAQLHLLQAASHFRALR